nr:phospholipase-like protein [Tanacetum cinerariifolium]
MGSYCTELEDLRSSPHIGSAVDVFLRMVEDLEDWNDFPLGEHMWRELYAAIRNVNSNHKQAHHKALEINPNFVPTYSLSGFIMCFKCVLGDKYWSDQDGEPFFKYMGSINPSANKDVVNDLIDALDDLVDDNVVVEVDKYLSHDDFLKVQKLEAEKNRQQRIRLYYRGKENGVNILKSIDEGLYKMGTFRETLAESTEGTPHFGPKRPRIYSDLTSEEKDRYNVDIRDTNILLQGLPKDIYTLINHYTDAKDIWDNVKILLEGSELTKEDRESQLYDDFEHFRQHKR